MTMTTTLAEVLRDHYDAQYGTRRRLNQALADVGAAVDEALTREAWAELNRVLSRTAWDHLHFQVVNLVIRLTGEERDHLPGWSQALREAAIALERGGHDSQLVFLGV